MAHPLEDSVLLRATRVLLFVEQNVVVSMSKQRRRRRLRPTTLTPNPTDRANCTGELSLSTVSLWLLSTNLFHVAGFQKDSEENLSAAELRLPALARLMPAKLQAGI